MTRIIAGEAGGRRLRTPPGSATRPTADRVREALFSTLESLRGSLYGCRFLDAYAGSGAIGLEARSRGAATVTLVEKDRPTAALIRANAKELGMAGVRVLAVPIERFAAEPTVGDLPFDVAFFDPPYDVPNDDLARAIRALERGGRLAGDALLVVERARHGEAWRWPAGLETLSEKRYGGTVLCYGQRDVRADSAHRDDDQKTGAGKGSAPLRHDHPTDTEAKEP